MGSVSLQFLFPNHKLQGKQFEQGKKTANCIIEKLSQHNPMYQSLFCSEPGASRDRSVLPAGCLYLDKICNFF